MSKSEKKVLKTSIATLTRDQITVCGHDLVDDLIGKIDIGQLLFLEITGRLPDEGEARLVNAMVVSIAEHGMMPSVIAARMTLLGAPESFQGAVASGLLGVGDVFVGPASNVARMLQVESAHYEGDDRQRAAGLVEEYFSAGRRIPGLGHPHHPVDPRAEKLLELQRELKKPRRYTEMMLAVHQLACERFGRHLTFNGVAAVGAICSDLGIDWRAVRGIGLVARTVGLVGHVLEEMKQPMAGAIWDLVHDNTQYTDPTPK